MSDDEKTATVEDTKTDAISASDARYTGETNVEKGALARAEARVAARTAGAPVATGGDQPYKVWVDDESGAVVTDPNELGPRGGIQLVGAEATAYAAKHGVGKAAESRKKADDGENKARKGKTATKRR